MQRTALTKFTPLKEHEWVDLEGKPEEDQTFYDYAPDIRIGPDFDLNAEDYCPECAAPIDAFDIDEHGDLMCPSCGFIVEDDNVDAWVKSRAGTNYVREAIRMAQELTKFTPIQEQLGSGYKMVSGKNQTTPQGDGSVAQDLKRRGSPSDPASTQGKLPGGGKLSTKFDSQPTISDGQEMSMKEGAGKLQESFDDFIANYSSEIKKAIKDLKAIQRLLKPLYEANSPFLQKWEADPRDPLKMVDPAIQAAIMQWIEQPYDVSAGEIARAAVANQTKTGTEPQFALFAVEDLLRYLERCTKGMAAPDQSIVHEKTLTAFKPLSEDGAAGRTMEYATETKNLGADSTAGLPSGGELPTEFDHGNKISAGQEMMPEKAQLTPFTALEESSPFVTPEKIMTLVSRLRTVSHALGNPNLLTGFNKGDSGTQALKSLKNAAGRLLNILDNDYSEVE